MLCSLSFLFNPGPPVYETAPPTFRVGFPPQSVPSRSPSQTCLEVCFHGASKTCQADNHQKSRRLQLKRQKQEDCEFEPSLGYQKVFYYLNVKKYFAEATAESVWVCMRPSAYRLWSLNLGLLLDS